MTRGPQTEDIHVVMFHTLVRRVGIVAKTGADTGDFVGGYGGTDPAAADQDAPLRFAGNHCPGNRHSEIRIIVLRVKCAGAKVSHRVPASEPGNKLVLKHKTAVVRADYHA
jgi:hypothetical protein